MAPPKKDPSTPGSFRKKLTLFFVFPYRDFHESSSISIFSPRNVPLHYYFVSKRSPVAHVPTKASIFWHLVLLPSMQWHPADRWKAWNRSWEKSTCLNLKGSFSNFGKFGRGSESIDVVFNLFPSTSKEVGSISPYLFHPSGGFKVVSI